MSQKDIYFMKKAINLAKKGTGETSPNPLVGAVIVKNNKIIGTGFHKRCGLAHAEINALKKAGNSAKGATLYINLEPCSHFGKTPPCVDEVIKAGIKRVVIAIKDPNPQVWGKAIRKLKKQKIEVSLGVCKKEALELNEIFLKNMKESLPFVVAKVAQSLDGKIATKAGQSKWITTKSSRQFSYQLRDKYDAVLIGAETLRKDNPRLNGLKKIPYKIIISSDLNLPKKSYLFKNFPSNTVVFTSHKHKSKNKLPPEVKVISLRMTKRGFSLKQILKKLYSFGIMSVFIEGGSETLGRFFQQKLIDKVYFFIAPMIFGGKDSLTSIGADGFSTIKESAKIKNIEIEKIDQDILISGYPSQQ
ncbi:MAG: bifunctional diaminohydroxyphosphoribosylaminopyrimidine deaminase/5-amino-6-(5-phosphoribosylamino)uracil reductase RibD [Candidatus Omnitrophica bacterium]|nr:bifunctional diaminohydroxyphosphoribosylaminopyrimidine deaminase/5-amino-6-(5-phosphoribosylamino)uracil reductase RibD [Candidatus Omnitrophota bacterium]